MNPTVADWYLLNIRALVRIYGEITFNQNTLSWILITKYILPPDFNRKDSALLIITPKEDLMKRDGFEFYLNKRLVRTDGKPICRFHDDDTYNRYANKGYSRLSFHLYDFRPTTNPERGDNLVDVCESLYNFLGDERGVI